MGGKGREKIINLLLTKRQTIDYTLFCKPEKQKKGLETPFQTGKHFWLHNISSVPMLSSERRNTILHVAGVPEQSGSPWLTFHNGTSQA